MATVAAASQAYHQAKRATAGPRTIEASAFERINGELERNLKSAALNHPAFIEALSKNATLWTVLASDVMRFENALPAELKAKIFNLSMFVRRQTQKLMNGDKIESAGVIVEINRNMIAGLRQSASKEGA